MWRLSDDPSAQRLLTRHFLKRFVENDVISPHADRHESLALACGVIVSIALFITLFLTGKYLASFVQLPGPTAISALSDRFILVGASMTITALVTLVVWDALAVEARDGAILGPLPIRTGTIVRAKLTAIFIVAGAFALAISVFPSVFYPSFLTFNLGIGAPALLRLIAVHGASVTLAALFGFSAVLAIRGALQAVLGDRLFGRVSASVQTALVVLVGSSFLLLPALAPRVSSTWLTQESAAYVYVPPLWFLGVYEVAGGDVVVDTPGFVSSRLVLRERLTTADRQLRARYRGYRARLQELAKIALSASLLTLGVAVGCYLWNSRRLPLPVPAPERSFMTRVIAGATPLLARDPEAQAAFVFALRALTRSAPHRLLIAASLAVSVTVCVLTVHAALVSQSIDTTLGILSLQTTVVAAVLAGFRYAAGVPVAPQANWAVQLSWSGDERAYLSGAKRAAIAALIALPLLAFAPLNAALLGPPLALAHLACGVIASLALLELLFLGVRRLPFACSYLPLRNPKLFWPASLCGLLAFAFGLAAVERWSASDPRRLGVVIAALLGLAGGVTILDRYQRRRRHPIDFDELPELPTQRLGLSERMGRA